MIANDYESFHDQTANLISHPDRKCSPRRASLINGENIRIGLKSYLLCFHFRFCCCAPFIFVEVDTMLSLRTKTFLVRFSRTWSEIKILFALPTAFQMVDDTETIALNNKFALIRWVTVRTQSEDSKVFWKAPNWKWRRPSRARFLYAPFLNCRPNSSWLKM